MDPTALPENSYYLIFLAFSSSDVNVEFSIIVPAEEDLEPHRILVTTGQQGKGAFKNKTD